MHFPKILHSGSIKVHAFPVNCQNLDAKSVSSNFLNAYIGLVYFIYSHYMTECCTGIVEAVDVIFQWSMD